MPVLSPHHTSSSYRSAFNNSLDRPSYYHSSSFTPRISSYSERFTTRSYIDSDGRRTFTRSGSITEDGVTSSRFKEELRDGSVRRESMSKDYDYNGRLRDNIRDGSLSRESRLSSVGVIDDVTELRNKYSPSNYVPAIHRKNDNMGRSKSINDIGLPPIEKSTSSSVSKKKVTALSTSAGGAAGVAHAANNANNLSVLNGSNNDNNGLILSDDNGNRATVADLCRKFDKSTCSSPENNRISIRISNNIDAVGDVKVSNNKFKILDQETNSNNKNTRKISTNATNGRSRKIEQTAANASTEKSKMPSVHKENNPDEANNKPSVTVGRKNLLDKTKKTSNNEKPKIKMLTTATAASSSKVPENLDETKPAYLASNGVSDNNESGKSLKQLNNRSTSPKNGDNNESSQSGVVLQNQNEAVNGGGDISATIPAKKTTIINVVFEGENVESSQKDLESSPKLANKSRVSPSSNSTASGSVVLNSNSLGRKSIEKERRSVGFDNSDIYDKPTGLGGYRLSSGSPTTVGGAAATVKTLGLNGLKNIGNTCFMNSVIQCLSNTKLLLEYLRHDDYVRDINQSNSSMKGALIKAFAEVIKELWADEACDRVINTVSLKSQIQRFAPRFIGYAQQDAQEFLRYLLEGLHEDVNRVVEKPTPIHTEIDDRLDDLAKSSESWNRYLRMDNSKIVDIFVGQLKSTLKCTFCGHCSVTFDPFWDLSLPIPTRTGPLRLSQCLESFTREETLDGDEKPTCSKCKERRKCTKSFSIQKFPRILVIHLKRFSPTERFRGKLSVTVDFPLESLDMSKYAADGVSSSRYNLYAVSNHSGTTYSGHYTAYTRHPYAMTWHEYNDSRVSAVSPRSVVSSEAYVLFYEQEGHRSHL